MQNFYKAELIFMHITSSLIRLEALEIEKSLKNKQRKEYISSITIIENLREHLNK